MIPKSILTKLWIFKTFLANLRCFGYPRVWTSGSGLFGFHFFSNFRVRVYRVSASKFGFSGFRVPEAALLWTDLPNDSLLILKQLLIKITLLKIRIFQWQFFRIFYHSDFFGLVSSSFVALVVSQLSNFFTQDQDCLKEKLKSQTSIWATLLKKYGWSQKHCSKTLTGVQQWRYGKNFFSSKNNIHTIYLFGTKIALTYI